MEKYSRGRRGAPAKGVGRVTGAKVQILSSPPKTRNVLRAFRIFLFCAEKKGFVYLCTVAHNVSSGADNAAQPRRKARFSGRQAKLLRERCAQRNKARSAKALSFEAREE